MIVELAHLLLFVAFGASVLQAALSAMSSWNTPALAFESPSLDMPILKTAERAALASVFACILAYAGLTYAFVRSDFSVRLVYEHSHLDKPLLYKITGVWGNHEGSLLLWCLILALCTALLLLAKSRVLPALWTRALSVQGGLFAVFTAFSLLTSNSFARMMPIPLDGQGLNPVLQDPALAIHPPLLYMGYVGFSVCFSLAVAGLWHGKIDSAWAKAMRPWAIGAWSMLTAGISLGSWWAYYELGWGGWWFWDPVENAALLPWLSGTALVHSILVLEKRGAFPKWTVLLAIITFLMSMLGTFLVRSGILTSVHAFANDPERGLMLLGIVAVLGGVALWLFAVRAKDLPDETRFFWLSRDSGLVFNNYFLCLLTLIVMLGTLYPIWASTTGRALSIGPTFFHATAIPIALVLLAFMAIAPLLGWKKQSVQKVPKNMIPATAAAITGGLLWVLLMNKVTPIGLGGWVMGCWLLGGTLAIPLRNRATTWANVALWLGHSGLAIAVLGMTAAATLTREEILILYPNQSATFGAYDVSLKSTELVKGQNYVADQANIEILPRAKSGHISAILPAYAGYTPVVLHPQRRWYPIAGMQTSEVSMNPSVFGDSYAVLGSADDPAGSGGGAPQFFADSNAVKNAPRTIRLSVHPLVGWIWFGAAVMALGGLCALVDSLRKLSAKPKSKASPELTADILSKMPIASVTSAIVLPSVMPPLPNLEGDITGNVTEDKPC